MNCPVAHEGPCMPRVSDGLCIWCGRELPARRAPSPMIARVRREAAKAWLRRWWVPIVCAVLAAVVLGMLAAHGRSL